MCVSLVHYRLFLANVIPSSGAVFLGHLIISLPNALNGWVGCHYGINVSFPVPNLPFDTRLTTLSSLCLPELALASVVFIWRFYVEPPRLSSGLELRHTKVAYAFKSCFKPYGLRSNTSPIIYRLLLASHPRSYFASSYVASDLSCPLTIYAASFIYSDILYCAATSSLDPYVEAPISFLAESDDHAYLRIHSFRYVSEISLFTR